MNSKNYNEKHKKMCVFIYKYIECNGYSPSYRDIGIEMGFVQPCCKVNTSQVVYYLNQLEELNMITRQEREARTVRLTDAGIEYVERCLNIKPKHKRGVPHMGYIAAGEPCEIFTEPGETIDLGQEMYSDDIYALIVKGTSMIDDGILDGDYVFIDPQVEYVNGMTVVAVQRKQGGLGGATLKRFYKEKGRIRLQPANSELKPIYISAEEWTRDWQLQGRVIEVRRKYAII